MTQLAQWRDTPGGYFGVDIGGGSVKIARVDQFSARVDGEVLSVPTPHPATPEGLLGIVADCIPQHAAGVGVAFPAPVIAGVTTTATNVDPQWIGFDLHSAIRDLFPLSPTAVLNDADAAGLAELRSGTISAHVHTALVLTLGTGIGSALIHQGMVVPNTELGKILIDTGSGLATSENFAAPSVRANLGLSLGQWAERLSLVLQQLEILFSPQLLIVGGGISEQFRQWERLVCCKAPLQVARSGNSAGIIGAALAVSS